jgi:hypothetical protein
MVQQRFFFWLCGLAMFALVNSSSVFAEEVSVVSEGEGTAGDSLLERAKAWEITAGAGMDVFSEYVWRGQVLDDGIVSQPSAYIGVENFTASFWGNYSLDVEDEWTELDYILDYTTCLDVISPKLEKASLSVGYIYYDFPHLPAGDDSQELYARAAVDTLLSPYVSVYWDFDQGDGTYYEAGVSHSHPLGELSVNLCASVGYNDGQWDYDSSFSAALFGAGLAIPVGERIIIEPSLYYSLALDSQYDDELYGGLSVSFLIWE